jgi:hypothetical protein
MKFNLVIHPKAYGGQLEFRSLNKRNKAFVVVGNTNGHYWLQFHDAKGYMTSYIHEVSKNNFVNECGLYMPKYIYPLIETAISYINKFYN